MQNVFGGYFLKLLVIGQGALSSAVPVMPQHVSPRGQRGTPRAKGSCRPEGCPHARVPTGVVTAGGSDDRTRTLAFQMQRLS